MKLVDNHKDTISIHCVDKRQVIIWFEGNKPKYKLHVIEHSPDIYAFVNLEDSFSWANGTHSSLKAALEGTFATLGSKEYIEVFDTFNDFLKYCKSL